MNGIAKGLSNHSPGGSRRSKARVKRPHLKRKRPVMEATINPETPFAIFVSELFIVLIRASAMDSVVPIRGRISAVTHRL